jgi:hypothetical protein
VIHSLDLTIGLDQRLVRKFDSSRKKRNLADYERAGAVSDLEVDGMRELAVRLRSEVEEWIRRVRPDLSS